MRFAPRYVTGSIPGKSDLQIWLYGFGYWAIIPRWHSTFKSSQMTPKEYLPRNIWSTSWDHVHILDGRPYWSSCLYSPPFVRSHLNLNTQWVAVGVCARARAKALLGSISFRAFTKCAFNTLQRVQTWKASIPSEDSRCPSFRHRRGVAFDFQGAKMWVTERRE